MYGALMRAKGSEDSELYRCGAKAAAALAALFNAIPRPITCIPTNLDQYGRAVALCSLGRLVAKVTSCCAAKDRSGTDDLVVVRDYMALGLRARAADLMTRKLGSETEVEAASKLYQEVGVDRFAGLALFSACVRPSS